MKLFIQTWSRDCHNVDIYDNDDNLVVEHQGYAPDGGDGMEFEVDLDTGKVTLAGMKIEDLKKWAEKVVADGKDE